VHTEKEKTRRCVERGLGQKGTSKGPRRMSKRPGSKEAKTPRVAEEKRERSSLAQKETKRDPRNVGRLQVL